MHFEQYVFTQIASFLLTKDNFMELFTPSEDEDELDYGQLEIEYIYD